jgi:hypothetical protein
MAKTGSKPKRKAKKPSKANYAGNVILHLSDLHFGYDIDVQAKAERKNALDHLISIINSQEPDWKPTIICITGDIAMRAKPSDYSEAKIWISDLLNKLKLTSKSLIICPGNHDVVRKIALGYAPPTNSEVADRMLCFDYFQNHKSPFGEFQKFCSSLSIPPYLIGRKKSYLTGIRYIKNIKFVCLNSAWFSQRNIEDDKFIDDGKLWIGLPLLIHLESKGLFPYYEGHTDSIFTIVIFHHPFESLHDNERNKRPPRKSTKEYIAYHSHIVLTGHDHSAPCAPDQIHTRSYHFRCGASYSTPDYKNSFHLIKLDKNYLIDKAYEFDSSSVTKDWKVCYESKPLYFWSYQSSIVKAVKLREIQEGIVNNLRTFEKEMLEGNYATGLSIVEKAIILINQAQGILFPNEIDAYRIRYGQVAQRVFPILTNCDKDKLRMIIKYIMG